jgi:hypothetical protein
MVINLNFLCRMADVAVAGRAVGGHAVDTVDSAKEGLMCSECKLILDEAVQTSDGLRLCQKCFDFIKE